MLREPRLFRHTLYLGLLPGDVLCVSYVRPRGQSDFRTDPHGAGLAVTRVDRICQNLSVMGIGIITAQFLQFLPWWVWWITLAISLVMYTIATIEYRSASKNLVQADLMYRISYHGALDTIRRIGDIGAFEQFVRTFPPPEEMERRR